MHRARSLRLALDVHVFLHDGDAWISKRLDAIDHALSLLLTKGVFMATIADVNAKLDALAAAQTTLSSEVGEEIVILQEIKAALDAAIAAGGGDPVALQAIADRIDGVTTALTASTDALDAAGKAVDITPGTVGPS
jgi:hypothetical protein